MLMCLVVLRDYETATRVFVEAVDDSWALFAANPRKVRAMMEQRVHDRVRLITCPGMNDETGGLVENEQIVVFEKKLQRNVFGLRIEHFQLRLNQTDDIAAVNCIARMSGLPVQLNI